MLDDQNRRDFAAGCNFHIRIADGTEVTIAFLQDEPRHFFFSVGTDRT